MRLFIGLWLDDAATCSLASWAKEAQALCGGRIMRRADMHLTLAFLGDANESHVRVLVNEVGTWSGVVRPFILRHVGVFERARVVWAGPDPRDGLDWLYTLYNTVWYKLVTLGWQPPERMFRPHVSLLREAGVADLTRLKRPPVLCTPVRCVLVASRPKDDRTSYDVLASIPITRAR